VNFNWINKTLVGKTGTFASKGRLGS